MNGEIENVRGFFIVFAEHRRNVRRQGARHAGRGVVDDPDRHQRSIEMNIRDSIALCVLGVSCAPMLAAANDDVHGVKNGSFLESEYWFRSHPCLCLLYTSPSPRDGLLSRMPSSA